MILVSDFRILGACVFSNETQVLSIFLAKQKANGRIVSVDDDTLSQEFYTVLSDCEMGEHPDIDEARHKRSREVHEEAALAKKKRLEDQRNGVKENLPMENEKEAQLEEERAQEREALEKSRYKILHDLFSERYCFTPDLTPKWRTSRLIRAKTIFEQFLAGKFKAEPNARSFVIMMYGAMAAEDIATAKEIFKQLMEGGVTSENKLFTIFQPSFLLRLLDQGIIPEEVVEKNLSASPLSSDKEDIDRWCFLQAAWEATGGDQFGSKHGAVLTTDPNVAGGAKLLASGRNHRFAPKGDPHLRVMHSEVHCLVQLPNEALAKDSEVWVVELDGVGAGYEEAVPCAMCNKALHGLGVKSVAFSSHSGIKRQTLVPRPGLLCEAYELAKKRTYPETTQNPDGFGCVRHTSLHQALLDAQESLSTLASDNQDLDIVLAPKDLSAVSIAVESGHYDFNVNHWKNMIDPGRGNKTRLVVPTLGERETCALATNMC